ncbi:MAG: thioredoxin-disulfide reductase [Deltaproteobacteria bacterium]|nr:thioredoxin-disulfide reductase [Deltaproteobacteria bacterium]
MRDLIIIGGGPAGLTAGIYASRARLDVQLLEMTAPGGQILVSDLVENYPGFPGGISGGELMERMAEQARRLDLSIAVGEVTSVDFSGPLKKLALSDGKKIETKTVIIATGATPRKLGVPGENRFYGRGVSYCATCDGPFFRDKVVVAVGGGDTAVQESLFLTKFAKKVHLVHRRDALRAARILQERALGNDKLVMEWDSVVTSINGNDDVESVTVKNLKTGKARELAADGCFVWVGIEPNSGFLKDAVKLDEQGFVVTDATMATSAPGVFAAGDVRNTPLRQVATAVGDAAIAAMSAEHYIETMK